MKRKLKMTKVPQTSIERELERIIDTNEFEQKELDYLAEKLGYHSLEHMLACQSLDFAD